MFSTALVAVLLASSPVALGKIFTTAPVASTNWQAGQQFSVTWQDDGSAPNLQAFGLADVGLYAGSQSQQTLLQDIGNVDVSTTNSVQFTPSASVGPNGASYFIRFTSVNLKDPNAPTFPAQAFSAIFTLSGMTGQFNASVQAQIAGSAAPASAPAASTPAASSPAASSPAASGSSSAAKTTSASGSSSAANTTSASHSAASTSASSTPKNAASGAARTAATGILSVAGAAALLSSILL
ncbi:hypothetical protein EVG20_g6197 [Dentipellis fragilis]|uniref:Yeast cell wall synthesis Kre9/Knh1-like N-terminal domain-containing protein n=1 Tax=Dentipellis fragilis TaxID=205917 RepID=A0A4Y9YPF5_9AGAM|nr:hypothetical protein EVG20_g6197 [Dentipellis fragilis]